MKSTMKKVVYLALILAFLAAATAGAARSTEDFFE